MAISYTTKDNIGTIEFDQPDSRVNLLTAEVLKEFAALLEKVKGDSSLEVLLITSGKRDVFIAGADIKEIEGITESKDGEAKSRSGQDIFNTLEDLSIPTVAVIDGVTLGGGCELVLACRWRVATFNEKVKMGLPEVNLGILPGFGGTYRLPRLVGLTQSLTLILAGKVISGKQALRIGLVDRLFPQKNLENSVYEFVEEVVKPEAGKKRVRKRQKGLPGLLDRSWIGQMIIFQQSRKNVLKLTKGFYPAPLKALRVIQKTLHAKRSKALKLEAETFSHLAVTDISKNLVKVFYLSEKYKKLTPPECEGLTPKPIHKCGVIGAGIMGGGIAQILSYKDITVRLKDINYEAIAHGLKAASRVFQQAVKKRKLKRAQAEAKMAMITGTVETSGFSNVDCIIEAVVENMDIKKKVFEELGNIIPPETIVCSNTSALSVREMSRATKDPSRVIGFHFFNPVHRMPLVEIIKTEVTSPETIAAALGLARRLSKTPILVKDAPGFLINRILLGYINEAGRLIEEGAGISSIDKIMTDFGMPMGPLTLSDEVGLDVGTKVLHILQEGLGERFQPAGIFEKIHEKGLLGKKSGKGFYLHKKKKRIPNPEIEELQTGKEVPPSSDQEWRDRMILIMVNEAARCLEEGIVDEASAVDVGMIMGTGFPPFRGGLLRYADSVGIGSIVDRLKLFQEKTGSDRFEPCQYLLDLKKNQKQFYSV